MDLSRLIIFVGLLGTVLSGQMLGAEPERRDAARRLPAVSEEPLAFDPSQVIRAVYPETQSPIKAIEGQRVGFIQAAAPLTSEEAGGLVEVYADEIYQGYNQPEPESTDEDFSGIEQTGDSSDRDSPFVTSSDDFEQGLVIWGWGAAMKIGGYVKVDMIQDFNAIDSTDTFDTTTIPVGAPDRTNSRAHARQSRINFDTRWPSDRGPIRVFIEADFFGQGENINDNRLQLRHAYGEYGSFEVGQTWTTFTDPQAIPTTLDNEGGVSSVKRRQGLIRWNQSIVEDTLFAAIALEDSRSNFEVPMVATGEPRTPSPDLIANVHLSREWGQLQIAGLARQLGYQPTGKSVNTENAWGFNFTGALFPLPSDKIYYQVLFGEGIGSYRGLPDVTASLTEFEVLGTFGWMIGWHHEWTECLSSNFTYSASDLDNAAFQSGDDLHEITYLAANLVWNPTTRMFVGIEYLFGTRTNVSGARGKANRLQMSFGFYLP